MTLMKSDRRAVLSTGLMALIGTGLPWQIVWAQATAVPLQFQLSWIKSIQYGGYFAGIENGAFKKFGVNPTFNSGGPNIDPVDNVASGQSVLGDRPSGPLIVARENGIPIKIIATVFQTSPFGIMSLASKPIRTAQELKGKTIAVSTSDMPLMMYVLKNAGLSSDSTNIVPAAPDPSALASGEIDGYCGYVTDEGVMLQTRGVKIFSLTAQNLGIPETAGTIYGREDFLAGNRQLVVDFLKGAIAGWKWAIQNPEATAKLMVDKYGNPGLDYNAQLTEIKDSIPFITAGAAEKKGLLAIDPALYEKIIGMYREMGFVKSNMTASDLCDSSFVDAALAN